MLWNTWSILSESAFFILIGFFIAGLLEMMLAGGWVTRLLSGARTRSVLLATLIGVPLPLCSCSVLPTAMTLRKKGAGKGPTLSFLISTPETSVTSVLLTYSLLGSLMAIFRPIAACVTAIIAGLVENVLEHRFPSAQTTHATTPPEPTCHENDHAHDHAPEPSSGDVASGRSRFRTAMRYAFVDLYDDIFGWVLVGIVAAAAIQAWLPPDVLDKVLGGTMQSMLLMVVIGVPLYVCAEASTPIAAVLIAQGMNPGAALVFLLVGPATNIGSLGVLYRQLGRRTVIVYLTTIIIVALFMGAWLNGIVSGANAALPLRLLDEPLVPTWLKTLAAFVFLAIGIASLRRLRHVQRLAAWLDARLPVAVSARGVKVAAAIAVVIVYLGSGFFTVGPGELGIVRRFGAITRSDVPPGLHYDWPYPLAQVDRVAVRWVHRLGLGVLEDAQDSWSLVGDENIADIKMAVHWGAMPERTVQFQFKSVDRERLVRSAVLGAAREVLAGASINRVLTADRPDCERQIEELAQQRLEDYDSGICIYAFQILDAHAPPDVHHSFRDVASALEDRDTKINEARASEAQMVPEARGEAAQRIAEAQSYASEAVLKAKGEADRFRALLEVYWENPEVTSQRLELEALEQVLPNMRKYLKPVGADVGQLEIWFVQDGAAEEIPLGTMGP